MGWEGDPAEPATGLGLGIPSVLVLWALLPDGHSHTCPDALESSRHGYNQHQHDAFSKAFSVTLPCSQVQESDPSISRKRLVDLGQRREKEKEAEGNVWQDAGRNQAKEPVHLIALS